MSIRTLSMAFNIISFIQRATGGAVPVADDQPLPVAAYAPIGGDITWGNPTAVAMTGSSKNLVAANASRKAIAFWNPAGNAAAAYSLSGSVVTLAGGFPLPSGNLPVVLEGAVCPVGAITVIGTSGQNLYYCEGT